MENPFDTTIEFFDTEQVAKLLNLSMNTLYVWSSMGGGPHRMQVQKNADGRLQWPREDVVRVMGLRGRLSVTDK